MIFSLDLQKIENDLISEVKLSPIQAKIFLFITTHGKKTISELSDEFNISESDALDISNSLVSIGSLIDLSKTEFEAMHPRFTAVNMYRRMCERENIEFKRNKIVDNIGVVLEKSYDNARTK